MGITGNYCPVFLVTEESGAHSGSGARAGSSSDARRRVQAQKGAALVKHACVREQSWQDVCD